ncbi:HalOD1 output domain-containing protein [Salinarchaeum laminariae]|uniref:HalOD1 output domain-containing protein n=1 Tax=Salinarchaeum laminariae TaxID=869888 RepID=UPI0020C12902|nr:HalOD1 output domain-containing protein [Salinarchaeum laminariae]
MRETDAEIDSGGVQEATRSSEFESVSTRRYSVAPDEPLDVAVVYAVAASKGVDPMGLDEPLNGAIDADALRQLFASAGDSLTARFVLDGCEVSIVDGGDDVIVSTR